MVCLGFEPGTSGWYAQTKPQSYGGRPYFTSVIIVMFDLHCHVTSKVRQIEKRSSLRTIDLVIKLRISEQLVFSLTCLDSSNV